MKKTMVLLAGLAVAMAAFAPSVASAKGDKGKSCIQRQKAKGATDCIAKAKCAGIESRSDQARMCN